MHAAFGVSVQGMAVSLWLHVLKRKNTNDKFVLNCRGHQRCLVRLVVRTVAGSVQPFPSSIACFPRSERLASQHHF